MDAIARDIGAAAGTAFEVCRVRDRRRGRIPTRVMHQLIYGKTGAHSRLHSSIAVGLMNAATFKPDGKTGFCWGQFVAHPDYESRLGLCFDTAAGSAASVSVQFYTADGLCGERSARLAPGDALIFDGDDFSPPDTDLPLSHVVPGQGNPERADLSAQSFHAHRHSHNASGEHNF